MDIDKVLEKLTLYEKLKLVTGQNDWETFAIEMLLGRDAFAYFSTSLHEWHINEGKFEILVGASSADIRLKAKVYIKADRKYS